jgi:hypothetical protein
MKPKTKDTPKYLEFSNACIIALAEEAIEKGIVPGPYKKFHEWMKRRLHRYFPPGKGSFVIAHATSYISNYYLHPWYSDM